MMNLQVGMKVVCVNDSFEPWAIAIYTALPKKDQTYVIRDIRLGVNYHGKNRTSGAISVLLIGVINPMQTSKMGLEMGFDSDRFRPLEEIQEENKAKAKIPELETLKVMPAEQLKAFVHEFNK